MHQPYTVSHLDHIESEAVYVLRVWSPVADGHPAKRLAILPTVVLIQTCLGGVYA